jgi:hypothetical protein
MKRLLTGSAATPPLTKNLVFVIVPNYYIFFFIVMVIRIKDGDTFTMETNHNTSINIATFGIRGTSFEHALCQIPSSLHFGV